MNPFKRVAIILLATIVATPLVLVASEAIVPPEPAAAAELVDFDPGYLISDALFYDGSAMTAAQVQVFLEQKEAGCYANATCLYESQMRTPSMSAETGLCGAYSGSALERGSDVIAKVGKACGISQKVLMVLIQKEQHLISSKNPTQWAYDQATGFACPDTAPCDAGYSGFFFQVWYAARQFKYYQWKPQVFNHQANRWNNIRLSPIASCLSLPVFIQNQATAGLYNYTPYQPNPSALQNMYGEGDICGSYGNRNFWSIYTDWFGSTRPASAIETFHAANGGNGGAIGRAQWNIEYFLSSGGGTGQRYANASIMSSTTAGTWAVMNGPIRNEYIALGGPAGSMGWPTAAQTCAGTECSQSFQGGLIGNNPITKYQQAQGGDSGPLGKVTAPVEFFAGNGGGMGQRFANASVMYSASAGTWAVMNGSIRDEYIARGGPNGSLGWPTAAQVCSGSACTQVFQGGTLQPGVISQFASANPAVGTRQGSIESFAGNGGGIGQRYSDASIMSSPTQGTWAVMNGPIRDEYITRGGPNGSLGWPVAAQDCSGTACTQAFQGGTIIPNSIAQYASTNSAIGAALGSFEFFSGSGGGTGQRFANASVMSSRTAGTWAVMNGAIRDEYIARSGANGVLGWPTAEQVCAGTVCYQAFQGGVVMPGIIEKLQSDLGGNAGVLGASQGKYEYFAGNGGGVGKRYAHASVMASPSTGSVAVMDGPIRDEYIARGGSNSSLGWPTASQVCSAGTCTQSFQGGNLSAAG